ncbi:hypothetical protein K469DRAFT_705036 [Zopfia rhizophila CBS 207.26]|uniref:DUF4219 domain-containing protein n=1 Tax=Zopfia rhizophila CBS 207.26 TaxID=1314779 RepID=A0A6A6E601_9PEZI|nr:hypothetical protein K469DRAFT_705036 [Zopfia rhizophila CBS 207.26]
MKLYGTTNYFEWSKAMRTTMDPLDLLPIIDSTVTLPPGPNSDVQESVDYMHKNTHALKLLTNSLSDEIYMEVFTANPNASPALLSSAKALWEELKARYQAKDVVRNYLALHRSIPKKWDCKTPIEIHVQSFSRNLRKLNELASIHGLETIPGWYQVTMLLGSIEGVDEGLQEKAVDALSNGLMKKVGKLKIADLAGDMGEGRHWVKELEVRRKEGGGVSRESEMSEKAPPADTERVDIRRKA